MLVRVANLRYWLWRGGHSTAQQIARQLPLQHWGRMLSKACALGSPESTCVSTRTRRCG